MFKYLLASSSNGINWMAIFALLTFVAMFCISAVVIFRRSKDYVDKMAHLPLEDAYPLTTETTNNHEQ